MADNHKMTKASIAVVGAGPAGMTAALNLAHHGFHSILIGPETDPNDLRTTALMMPAIHLLEKLEIWKDLQKHTAALSTMRIIDGTSRLIRSPTVNFRASEIGQKAFGYNMPNIALNAALSNAVNNNKYIARHLTPVKSIEHAEDHVSLMLSDKEYIKAQLIIAADGRRSPTRDAAGICSREWSYPQTAVILSFSHTLPHYNISTEFHTEDGPFTQVPLNGNRSSLVWVTNPQRASELLSMGKERLSKVIEQRMQSMLGVVHVETPAQAWPLSGIIPKAFAAKRTILVGEAAHVFPPIGAQGLNLGFQDAVNLVDAVVNHKDDFGNEAVMTTYNRLRKPEIWARTGSVHALNRALLSDLLPAQIARSMGLEILRNVAPLRNLFMREGMHHGHGLKEVIKSLSFSRK